MVQLYISILKPQGVRRSLFGGYTLSITWTLPIPVTQRPFSHTFLIRSIYMMNFTNCGERYLFYQFSLDRIDRQTCIYCFLRDKEDLYLGVPAMCCLSTSIDFIENQLSPIPVCLSLQTHLHQSLLLQTLVQALYLEVG